MATPQFQFPPNCVQHPDWQPRFLDHKFHNIFVASGIRLPPAPTREDMLGIGEWGTFAESQIKYLLLHSYYRKHTPCLAMDEVPGDQVKANTPES